LTCWVGVCVLLLAAMTLDGVEGDVWQKWSDRAYRMCIELVKRVKQTEGKCDNIQEVVETALHGLASSMAAAMEKDVMAFRDELVLNSLKMPYRAQGERIIKETVIHIVKNDIKKVSEMQKEFGKRFGQWFLDLAVDNKKSNPYAGMSIEEIQATVKKLKDEAKPQAPEPEPMDPAEFDKLPIKIDL